jgi:hypothetical protein
MNHSSVKHQTVMDNNITSHNNMNHSYGKPDIRNVNMKDEWFILLWLVILLTITV